MVDTHSFARVIARRACVGGCGYNARPAVNRHRLAAQAFTDCARHVEMREVNFAQLKHQKQLLAGVFEHFRLKTPVDS
jgi:hypothetical protein